MNNQQKQANARYFEKMWGMINVGGTWSWKDKKHIYTKMPSGKMKCKSMVAWKDLRDITPKGWAKANCSLERTTPTTTTSLGQDDSVYHECPKCNQTYITKHRTKDLAKIANDSTSIEQWCSGICGDECWYACSEAEIIQHKFINPKYEASAPQVVFIGGGDGTGGVGSF